MAGHKDCCGAQCLGEDDQTVSLPLFARDCSSRNSMMQQLQFEPQEATLGCKKDGTMPIPATKFKRGASAFFPPLPLRVRHDEPCLGLRGH